MKDYTEQDRIVGQAKRSGWRLTMMEDGRTAVFRKGDHTISVTFSPEGTVQRASVDFDTIHRSRMAAVMEALRSLA